MTEMQQAGSGGVTLTRAALVPSVQRIGMHDIEVTYLGVNARGLPTWILWRADEPYLIGMLSQGRLGYHFEQRTSTGVMYHENVSLNRVQRVLER